ncbi:MAG TPA: hypothetical protein VFP68_14685 [Burkholderiaceae bacterium]|nr:hypothetical protein [Burkholderiaceae bacterium]
MRTETPKFNEWLSAEAEAQAAERQLLALMLQYERNDSAPTLDKFLLSIQAQRARAHRLFDEAMQELKLLGESLHHRRILFDAGRKSA